MVFALTIIKTHRHFEHMRKQNHASITEIVLRDGKHSGHKLLSQYLTPMTIRGYILLVRGLIDQVSSTYH